MERLFLTFRANYGQGPLWYLEMHLRVVMTRSLEGSLVLVLLRYIEELTSLVE